MTNQTPYNPKNHLILINNEIKENISYFQFDWKNINIKFENNEKIYPYKSTNIKILKEPKNIEANNYIFQYNEKLLFKIKKALYFWEWYTRIFFNNGDIKTSDEIEIQDNPIKNKEFANIIDYLKHLLSMMKDDEITNYLKWEYEKLDFILPWSVLHDFLLEKHKESSYKPNELIYPFEFNPSQKEAIENIFKSNISVIEWPPWTWKTQTILNIIANLAIMQDKTIAIVSNNNSAISNIKEKLEKQWYDFFISMLGKKENKDKFFSNLPKIKKYEIDKEIWDYSSKLEEISVLMDLKNEKKKLDLELSDYILEQEHFENYFNKQKIVEIFKLPLWAKSSNKLMQFLAENSIKSKYWSNKKLFHKIKLFIKYWFTEFKKLETKEIELILFYQKKFYELKTKELKNKISKLDKKLNENNYDDLFSECLKYSKIKFNNKLNSKFKKFDNFTIDQINYFKEFSEFKERFPVILSSTYAILSSVPKWFLFDYLIIDESSQVDLITWILVFSCCKNVVIVWDTKQLQHIPNLKECKLKIDEKFNYFKHNILSSVLSIYKDKIPVTLLKEHYRCHPKIINFCNQKYYNGELIIHTNEDDNKTPLVIYRSSEWNHMRDITNWEDTWKYNQREIDIIQDLLSNGKENLENSDDIWIITPFRKQVEKTNNALWEIIEIDTVHKFQWREKNTIIISTVLDNTRSWNLAIKFVDQPNLINVAVSRAQNKLIVVTDNNLFFTKWKELKDLMKYIEYSSLDKNIIDSDIVWVFDLLYKNLSTAKRNIKKVSKYDSENIWNALIEDLLKDEKFSNLFYKREVYLKNIINNTKKLNDEEIKFLNNNSRVDFLIYYKFWKSPLLIIEIDWVEFHENNLEQQKRDKKKNSILEKYKIPYLRLATNWSHEKEKIYNKLMEILGE